MKLFFRYAVALVLAAGCQPGKLCTPASYGYVTTNDVSYAVATDHVSPSGIHYDPSGQKIAGELLDRLTDEVAACLGRPIDRASFRVKIPSEWTLSCDAQQQLLPSGAPGEGCDAKGLQGACPCRWRAIVQCPDVIVTTPSLYLYKDALVRLVVPSADPWSSPALAKCASPSTGPLDVGK